MAAAQAGSFCCSRCQSACETRPTAVLNSSSAGVKTVVWAGADVAVAAGAGGSAPEGAVGTVGAEPETAGIGAATTVAGAAVVVTAAAGVRAGTVDRRRTAGVVRAVAGAEISGLKRYFTAGSGCPDAAAERPRVRVETICDGSNTRFGVLVAESGRVSTGA